ncbi:hypothetical protein [Xylophilus sp. Leaf220]|nr:hypothetical protein [Xylophilus sp. Leaf220]
MPTESPIPTPPLQVPPPPSQPAETPIGDPPPRPAQQPPVQDPRPGQ